MEKIPKIKLDGMENKAESKTKDPLYQLIEKNYYKIQNLISVDVEINEISDMLKRSAHLGTIDKKKFIAKIFDFESGKRKILDKIIEDLEIKEGDMMISDENDFIKKYQDVATAISKERGVREDKSVEGDKGMQETDRAQFEEEGADIAEMISSRLAERETEKQNIVDQDALKLEKIRSFIAKSLKEKNKKHVLDPQKELLKISDLVGKPSEKREALVEYKKDLKEQLLGIGEINAFLETEISKSKPLNLNKLRAYFEEQIKKYRLAPWQMERYKMVFDKISDTADVVDKFWNENKNKPGSQMLSNIFDYNPKGKIDVEKFTLALVFYCYDVKDFARFISKPGDKGNDLNEQTSGALTFEILTGVDMPLIFINNSQISDQEDHGETIIHEYKHAINIIIENAIRETNPMNIEIDDALKRRMEEQLHHALSQGKNEMLAFFKGGDEESYIYRQLTVSEVYDYFPSEEELIEDDELKECNHEEIANELNKFKTKYYKIIMDSLVVLKELEVLGFARQQSIGLLQAEKIENWPKVLKRITYDGELIKKNVDSIREEIYFHEEEEKGIVRDLKKMNWGGPILKLVRKKVWERLKIEIATEEAHLDFVKKIKEKLEKMLEQVQ